jgi:DNA polymerase-3 subunit gamma/tau
MTQVLYRKYRPKKFSEVVGQDHIVGILKAAVEADRISHAYLFSGPRGTGKTSVARILAEGIGCHEHDLLEMDAASSRGIDEIRSLRDSVYITPLRSKRKVYIIDEVHMLTKEAFNALLKTLEEPPAHAIFILATTEPEKLPDTIVSRCQHFAFKKIPEDILSNSLLKIAKKEGIEIDREAAGLLALFADGSFRDAQVMLDQLIATNKKSISGSEARAFLSAPSKELIQEFVASLVEKDSQRGLSIINQVAERGIGMQLFLKFILRDMRALLMIKLSLQSGAELEKILGKDDVQFLRTKEKAISVREAGFILLSLLDAYDKVNRAYLPQLPIELVLAKLHLRNTK